MSDEKTAEVKVCPSMSDASPTGTFIFSFISFLFWLLNIGVLSEGAVLAIGLAQVGVFVAYTVVAVTLLVRGDGFVGNMFLLFVAVFAGTCGFANVFGNLFPIWGIPFDDRVASIFLLMSGVFLLGMLPAMIIAKANVTDLLCNSLGGVGICGSALMMLGLIPGSLSSFFGWLLFGVGIVALYSFFAGMYGFLGVKLPVRFESKS